MICACTGRSSRRGVVITGVTFPKQYPGLYGTRAEGEMFLAKVDKDSVAFLLKPATGC